jgi:hypothetical protein
MKRAIALLAAVAALALAGCAGSAAVSEDHNRFGAVPCASGMLGGCPHTPIGNYDGWGRCAPGQCAEPRPQGTTYGCALGDTEVVVRGAKSRDPQTCLPVLGI